MKLPLTGYPGKLRPSAVQMRALLAVSKRTICSWTSRTSEVVKPDTGSTNIASWTGAGVGVGVGVDGVVGAAADPEPPPHPDTDRLRTKNRMTTQILIGPPFWRCGSFSLAAGPAMLSTNRAVAA